MSAKDKYIDEYGHHFNKKLFEYAVSLMTDRNGNRVKLVPKEQVTETLKANGVTIGDAVGWDVPYVFHMAKSDYFGNSLPNDAYLCKYVSDYLSDPDGNPCRAFDEWWINCVAKEEHIFWEEFL